MCFLLSGETTGSISREEFINQVAQDIQKKLPELFHMDVIRAKFGMDISPTSVVLLQELERFNKLVIRMKLSLAELQRVSRKIPYAGIFVHYNRFKRCFFCLPRHWLVRWV